MERLQALLSPLGRGVLDNLAVTQFFFFDFQKNVTWVTVQYSTVQWSYLYKTKVGNFLWHLKQQLKNI